MKIEQTNIEDLLIITPSVHQDERGYFFESYNQKRFQNFKLNYHFVQDNESFSLYGTIRGLHLQIGENAQAKLVRVLEGIVLDVAVDLRPHSKTFGQHFSIELSAENKKQFMIPRGFAHGFSVLSKTAVFSYKCDNFYNKEAESGILYNDKELNIDWRIPNSQVVINQKDLNLLSFSEFKKSVLNL